MESPTLLQVRLPVICIFFVTYIMQMLKFLGSVILREFVTEESFRIFRRSFADAQDDTSVLWDSSGFALRTTCFFQLNVLTSYRLNVFADYLL